MSFSSTTIARPSMANNFTFPKNKDQQEQPQQQYSRPPSVGKQNRPNTLREEEEPQQQPHLQQQQQQHQTHQQNATTLPPPSSSSGKEDTTTNTNPVDTSPSPKSSMSENKQHDSGGGGGSDDPALSALFGTSVSTWHYTDDALKQALAVRAEQERTKQEFYRCELLKRALEGNIPPQSIPLLFKNGNDFEAVSNQLKDQSPAALAASFAQTYPALLKQSKSQLNPLMTEQHQQQQQQHSPSSHQRNLSLPPQPRPQPQPQQQQPPAPPQQSTFRPGHHHHASTSAIPNMTQMSPRHPPPGPPQHTPFPTRGWQANQPYLNHPPPTQSQFSASPSSPSGLQVYQFHHYDPNLKKTTNVTSPKKDSDSGEQQGIKRQKSVSDKDRDRTGSPTPKAAPSGAAAAAMAHSNISRRRTMGHARHRSEASIVRSSDFHPYLGPPKSKQQPQQRGASPQPESGSESGGVSVLANVAAAESERQSTPRSAAQSTGPSTSAAPTTETEVGEERSRRHDVNFMIEKEGQSS